MKQIKIFFDSRFTNLEEQINHWLVDLSKNISDIEITSSSCEQGTTVLIVYQIPLLMIPYFLSKQKKEKIKS